MPDGAVALAVGAGMLAAVNPCGFALLPAYLSLLVIGDQPTAKPRAVARALALTAAMTLGFAAVFAVFGLLIAPVAVSAQRYLPWFTVGVGVVLLGAGVWLLAGRTLPGPRPRPRGAGPLTRSTATMVGYGASYAVASLTCTIAPFLAVIASAFRADSWWAGGALFVAYAAGMGLVVGTAAVAVAVARTALVGRLRQASRWVPRASGALLVLAGGYVGYYGWWEIRVLRGAAAGDPVVGAAGDLQHVLARGVDQLGAGGFALVLTALVMAVLGTALIRRRSSRRRGGRRGPGMATRAARPEGRGARAWP